MSAKASEAKQLSNQEDDRQPYIQAKGFFSIFIYFGPNFSSLQEAEQVINTIICGNVI